MQALRRATTSAAGVAERIRHLHVVPGDDALAVSGDVTVLGLNPATGDDVPEVGDDHRLDDRVVSLAAARARRSGHPAGSTRHR